MTLPMITDVLTDLLNKSLQLIKRAEGEQSMSNIEKDLLLANIRKIYDLSLDIPVQAEKKNNPTTVPVLQVIEPEIIETPPKIIAAPSENTALPAEIIQPQPVPVMTQIPPADHTRTIVTSIPPAAVPETIQVELSVQPQESEIKPIIIEAEEVKPGKPSFDDLVDKVKQQFNQGSQPQPAHSVTEDDEDDDVPVFFSDFQFDKLFDAEYAKELSEKLSASRVEDISKAMGLNEKIFTVNELFDGDHRAFEKAVNDIQALRSFDEAKKYITEQLAPTYNWMAGSKFKKAKEFIKLVKRKFP